jgi:CheY-like chemotaxis protein
MKILVVEDDENKRVQISLFLREAYPQAEVDLARSVQSGLRNIKNNLPNLILLDMSLPNYDTGPDEPGGTPHIFGGRELLRQLDRFDINVPTIVITQFEIFGKPPNAMKLPQLDEELRAKHAPLYRGIVYYHASIHGWKDELRQLIDKALKGQDGV